MKSLKTRELLLKKILKFILAKKVTNYQELCANFGLSKKTVSNYLNELEDMMKYCNVELVRKQNFGIYIEGDIQDLASLVTDIDSEDYRPTSKEERTLYVLVTLLSSSDYITIQNLADKIYVSRSTLENDLKNIRQYLQNYNIRISTSKKGIKIEADNKNRRKLIKEIINISFGNKIFINNNTNSLSVNSVWTAHMEQLLNEDILTKVLQSLTLFLKDSTFQLSDYEIQSLVIHLVITLDNIFKDKYEYAEDRMIMELEAETKQLVEIIEKTFEISIPSKEKESINMHILAVHKKGIKDIHKQENLLLEIVEVRRFLEEVLREDLRDSQLLDGLSIHLSSAIKRTYGGVSIFNPYTDEVKKTFPQAYEEAIILKEKVQEYFKVKMNDDECAFIALHFQSLFESSHYTDHRITAYIVCNYGIGSSRLLEQRIYKYFSNDINILGVLSNRELNERKIDADLIISTVPVDTQDIPCVVVSPVLIKEEVERLKNVMNEVHTDRLDAMHFFKLLDTEFIFHDEDITTEREAIEKIGKALVAGGYAKEGIVKSALDREEVSTTAFDNVALPHCNIKYIKQSKISILISKKGIQWDKNKVNFVIFMGLNKSVTPYVRNVYNFLTNVLDDQSVMNKLINSKNSVELLDVLYEKANFKEKDQCDYKS